MTKPSTLNVYRMHMEARTLSNLVYVTCMILLTTENKNYEFLIINVPYILIYIYIYNEKLPY